MESPQNARKPARGPHPPRSAPPPPRKPRLLAVQAAGIAFCVCSLMMAFVANSPLGDRIFADGSNFALYWLILAANVGAVVCAIGLALGRPEPAWSGAAVFLAVSFLSREFWFAVPFALGLLGCVLAWEMQRPRPPPSPVIYPWAWSGQWQQVG